MKYVQLICFSAQTRWVNKLADWSFIHRSRLQHDRQPLNQDQTVPTARVKPLTLNWCSSIFYTFWKQSLVKFQSVLNMVLHRRRGRGWRICETSQSDVSLWGCLLWCLSCRTRKQIMLKQMIVLVDSKRAKWIMSKCLFFLLCVCVCVCVGVWVSYTHGFTSLRMKFKNNLFSWAALGLNFRPVKWTPSFLFGLFLRKDLQQVFF